MVDPQFKSHDVRTVKLMSWNLNFFIFKLLWPPQPTRKGDSVQYDFVYHGICNHSAVLYNQHRLFKERLNYHYAAGSLGDVWNHQGWRDEEGEM